MWERGENLRRFLVRCSVLEKSSSLQSHSSRGCFSRSSPSPVPPRLAQQRSVSLPGDLLQRAPLVCAPEGPPWVIKRGDFRDLSGPWPLNRLPQYGYQERRGHLIEAQRPGAAEGNRCHPVSKAASPSRATERLHLFSQRGENTFPLVSSRDLQRVVLHVFL